MQELWYNSSIVMSIITSNTKSNYIYSNKTIPINCSLFLLPGLLLTLKFPTVSSSGSSASSSCNPSYELSTGSSNRKLCRMQHVLIQKTHFWSYSFDSIFKRSPFKLWNRALSMPMQCSTWIWILATFVLKSVLSIDCLWLGSFLKHGIIVSDAV